MSLKRAATGASTHYPKAFPTSLPVIHCPCTPAAAAAAGCCMVICTSQLPEDIVEILNGARKGTKFHPLANSLKGRKRWLLTGGQARAQYSCLVLTCEALLAGLILIDSAVCI